MTQTPTTAGAVVIRRWFPVDRRRLFEAWTRPEHIVAWWLPEGFTDPEVEVDVREGGGFRIGMTNPDGLRFTAVGTFTEVRVGERLVSTWRWEEWPEAGLSTLTVEFREADEGSELALEHTGLPTPEIVRQHEEGWTGCVDRLGPAAEA